ncbi:acetyl-CoA carboxylase [Anoxybacillus gonensis]|uniref:Biotin carboxyl carrier protein of acetyl-CoA carboxylase n=1 Tax=Anoxybacillus gonensis TaxID=198467 RepID=A0AAW7TFD9_9BACL|nr:acetyl-CoA carboxylase biotin carboxyl carrier protein [Anoxybacillus gonensis]AKS38865.1 acetyl-CoA carboxylase [Anoxybacillus gonensis]KGP60030.1 acetyl-CoA carboxylase [Anoxybacillus gonensis]MCX8047171.1 acetyl-CoA carboxylase biotin carboxyl carrier protein [Anoxybacillus gonensis]MDO0876197.1 acetyl-CoA carboxylase biotin carboxyl carrier protein [Anoxybacillus gonensis]
MLKIQEIRELIRLVNESNIVEFVYEHDGSKIKMKKAGATEQVVVAAPKVDVPQTAVVQQPVAPAVEKVEVKEEVKPEKQVVQAENLHTITSPMVGTFYAAPSPDAAPYVKVGDKVKKDTIVCIVEAMKLFNEIEAEVDGEIVEVLVKNGQLVEYGQPLFLVKPE